MEVQIIAQSSLSMRVSFINWKLRKSYYFLEFQIFAVSLFTGLSTLVQKGGEYILFLSPFATLNNLLI